MLGLMAKKCSGIYTTEILTVKVVFFSILPLELVAQFCQRQINVVYVLSLCHRGRFPPFGETAMPAFL